MNETRTTEAQAAGMSAKDRNAVILHGQPSREEYYDPNAPSMSNAHWLPWLQAQLLKIDNSPP